MAAEIDFHTGGELTQVISISPPVKKSGFRLMVIL
ncbi:hypothetical protein Pmgp_03268 [Pelotomaculum propionicicum]|uniref:Uncharacterized protein n=1 Tax=Pelotomaculum propionicicum TaxID=258475 RepID=A0A4Y7RKL6_9FIRM|nr:hypothetical protein Pmgp_03268 [Pelotomaculum propionicicum]